MKNFVPPNQITNYFMEAGESRVYFVTPQSIVRKIWGSSDTVLFIFAGAAAEFALNKAVDWLYFTGRLPSDPLARLFSTVQYAQSIVFSTKAQAHRVIDSMQQIHHGVEQSRGVNIPQWAYRDVLYLLVYYSIVSYELLERKLSFEEKEEVYQVFKRLGSRMGLQQLPGTYNEWLLERENHLDNNLQLSSHTNDLFKQYRKHLGVIRYFILVESQKLIVPEQVKKEMNFSRLNLLTPLVSIYKWSKWIRLDDVLRNAILPPQYKKQIIQISRISLAPALR